MHCSCVNYHCSPRVCYMSNNPTEPGYTTFGFSSTYTVGCCSDYRCGSSLSFCWHGGSSNNSTISVPPVPCNYPMPDPTCKTACLDYALLLKKLPQQAPLFSTSS